MSWRGIAAPIIAWVLAETQGQSEREIRGALRDAYPFGERRYYPYKAWLSEVRRQRVGGKVWRKPLEDGPLLALMEADE